MSDAPTRSFPSLSNTPRDNSGIISFLILGIKDPASPSQSDSDAIEASSVFSLATWPYSFLRKESIDKSKVSSGFCFGERWNRTVRDEPSPTSLMIFHAS